MLSIFRKPTGPTVAVLKAEIRILKDGLADLKHEKKITEEDIKHLVRLHDAKQEVETEKKDLVRDRAQATAIAEVKDTYRDKMETRLQTEVNNIKEMYGQILARLPKVSVRQFDSVSEEIKPASDD